MRLFAFRLDVNGKACARYGLLYGIFQSVANCMCRTHAHAGRNHQMKIDEGRRPCAPCSEIMHIDHADRMVGDRLPDGSLFLWLNRLVHQPAQ